MDKPFKFKEFTVNQDRCAMKIGTDGILLGAWASLGHQPETILDIGTGTGVIALMMAQRSSAGLIDALEIEDGAYEQAVENFENSSWGNRLFAYHAGFNEFVTEVQKEMEYDLIISNPPFYSEDYTSENLTRNRARFAEALPFEDLLAGIANLLSSNGRFDLIIPFSEESEFITLAAKYNLQPIKITRVRGHVHSDIKRSLLSLSFHIIEPKIDEIALEISRHNYTKEYQKLVEPFYLKI